MGLRNNAKSYLWIWCGAKCKMNKEFIEENRRKSRLKPMGKRSNEFVSTSTGKCRPNSLAVGRLSRALLVNSNCSDIQISTDGEVLLWWICTMGGVRKSCQAVPVQQVWSFSPRSLIPTFKRHLVKLRKPPSPSSWVATFGRTETTPTWGALLAIWLTTEITNYFLGNSPIEW